MISSLVEMISSTNHQMSRQEGTICIILFLAFILVFISLLVLKENHKMKSEMDSKRLSIAANAIRKHKLAIRASKQRQRELRLQASTQTPPDASPPTITPEQRPPGDSYDSEEQIVVGAQKKKSRSSSNRNRRRRRAKQAAAKQLKQNEGANSSIAENKNKKNKKSKKSFIHESRYYHQKNISSVSSWSSWPLKMFISDENNAITEYQNTGTSKCKRPVHENRYSHVIHREDCLIPKGICNIKDTSEFPLLARRKHNYSRMSAAEMMHHQLKAVEASHRSRRKSSPKITLFGGPLQSVVNNGDESLRNHQRVQRLSKVFTWTKADPLMSMKKNKQSSTTTQEEGRPSYSLRSARDFPSLPSSAPTTKIEYLHRRHQ